MKKKILKHILALAIGGALSSASAVQIDPDHFGKSMKDMGAQAAAGAAAAVVMLHVRAPKDDQN